VGGSNGANRLSGNAITEALVFGTRAGALAAARAARGAAWSEAASRDAVDLVAGGTGRPGPNTAAMLAALQGLMADKVGPFRTASGLQAALAGIAGLRAELGDTPPGSPAGFEAARFDWFDLRSMLLVAEVVATAALARTESRGAHQRDDHPGLLEEWTLNQIVSLRDGRLHLERVAVPVGGLEEVA